jgi:hypothetical protein
MNYFMKFTKTKISQVVLLYEMNVATKENCNVLTNLITTNSQLQMKFGEFRKKGNFKKIRINIQ